MTEEPRTKESNVEKLCPKCPPGEKRTRYRDDRGNLAGYCKPCLREYQRDYQRNRYVPKPTKPDDGRSVDRRIWEARKALLNTEKNVCSSCSKNFATAATKTPLCDDCWELIDSRAMVLTPGEYYMLKIGKSLKLAPDRDLINDPTYVPIPADDNYNVPGSPYNDLN